LRGYPSRPVVLVIGAPSDTAQAARIAAASGVSSLTPSLRDAMAIVAAADLVLTPNTALSHVASAVRVPVVEMLPRSHAAFAAYRTVGRSLMARDNNLMSIPVEQVIKALDGVLQNVPAKSDRGRSGGLEHSQAS
jgi:ADP-heptose:LPS heptosyltransferase